MEEYIEYMAYNRDDTPLYLFEPNLEVHPYAKEMCKDYIPGPMFQENIVNDMVRYIFGLSVFYRSDSRTHLHTDGF
jgi:hypothetical protein